MQKNQRYPGERGIIFLIALLSAFFPLSTDLYLPPCQGWQISLESPPA